MTTSFSLALRRGLARWLPAQQQALTRRLAGVATPTLVLWGENDHVASVENGRLLATLQPSAHLIVLSGAGHNLHQEQPEAVIKALVDFYTQFV